MSSTLRAVGKAEESGDLPANVEAERTVLGAVLLDPEVLRRLDGLAAGDFCMERHRLIFAAMAAVEADGLSVDPVTLGDRLARDAALEAIGGAAYLASLTDGLPRVPHPEDWARIVRDHAARRALIRAADRIAHEARLGEKSPAEALQLARDAFRATAAEERGPGFAPITVSQLYTMTADAIDWLWHELLPVGAFVLLASYMKAGKTTLLYALLSRLLRGLPFLDRPTRPCNVLLMALEENRRDVKRRLLKFGVPADARLHVQFRNAPASAGEWAELAEFVEQYEIELLILDTLARCWPVWGVDNENDNARVAAALAPLLDLCRDKNVTAVALHHTAKLAEGHGREVRGAGAILALADQALLFDRYRAGDPCDRIIRTLGRYDESPAEMVIRYDKPAATYTVLSQDDHDAEARGAERLFPQILAYLRRKAGTGATLRDVRSNVTGRGTTKDRALELLVERGQARLVDSRYYHLDHSEGVD